MLDTAAIEMHGAEQFVGRKEFGRERGWSPITREQFDELFAELSEPEYAEDGLQPNEGTGGLVLHVARNSLRDGAVDFAFDVCRFASASEPWSVLIRHGNVTPEPKIRVSAGAATVAPMAAAARQVRFGRIIDPP